MQFNYSNKVLAAAAQKFHYTTFRKRKRSFLIGSSLVLGVMLLQQVLILSLPGQFNSTSPGTESLLVNCSSIQVILTTLMIISQLIVLIYLPAQTNRLAFTKTVHLVLQLAYTVSFMELSVIKVMEHNHDPILVLVSQTMMLELAVLNLVFGTFYLPSLVFMAPLVVIIPMFLSMTTLSCPNLWVSGLLILLVLAGYWRNLFENERQQFAHQYQQQHKGETYEMFLNLLPEGIAILTGGHKLRYVNGSMRRILDCKKDIIVQKMLKLKNTDVKKSLTKQETLQSRLDPSIFRSNDSQGSVQTQKLSRMKASSKIPSRIDLNQQDEDCILEQDKRPSNGRLPESHAVETEMYKEPEEEVIVCEQKASSLNALKRQESNSYIQEVEPVSPIPALQPTKLVNSASHVSAEQNSHNLISSEDAKLDSGVGSLILPNKPQHFFRKQTLRFDQQASSDISFVSMAPNRTGSPHHRTQHVPRSSFHISSSQRVDNSIPSDRPKGHSDQSRIGRIMSNSVPVSIEEDPALQRQASASFAVIGQNSKMSFNQQSTSKKPDFQRPQSSCKPVEPPDSSTRSPFKTKVKNLRSYTTTHEDVGSACASILQKLKSDITVMDRYPSLRAEQLRSAASKMYSKVRGLFSRSREKKFPSRFERRGTKQSLMKIEEEDYCIVMNSKLNEGHEERLLEVKLTPTVIDEEPSILVLIKDTTERDIINRLQETDNYKNTLMASVSHELRTPLNCIITMQEMLGQYINEDLQCKYLRPALNSSKLLLSIVNDILDFAQIKAGSLRFQHKTFDLKEVLKDALHLFELSAHGRGIELRFDWDANLPQRIYSDDSRIRQIVVNLLSNAIKFTYEGHITLKAEYQGPRQLRISVIDTGVGIKQEDVRSLFSAFGKLDNDKMNPHGVGLGLMISQALARRMGSSSQKGIKVHSKHGEGSCFFFTLECPPIPEEQENNEESVIDNDSILSVGLATIEMDESNLKLGKIASAATDRIEKNFRVFKRNQPSTFSSQKALDETQGKFLSPFTRDILDSSSHTQQRSVSQGNMPTTLRVDGQEPASVNNVSFNIQSLHENFTHERGLLETPHYPRIDALESKNGFTSRFITHEHPSASPEMRNPISLTGTPARSELSSHQKGIGTGDDSTTLLRKSSFLNDLEKLKDAIAPAYSILESKSNYSNEEKKEPLVKSAHFSQVENRAQVTSIATSSVSEKKQMKAIGTLSAQAGCGCPDFLLVDDNDFNLLALSQLLESMNYKIRTARNGELAIQEVLKRLSNDCCQAYRIVFMDCDMPVKNGFDTTQELRALQKKKQLPWFPIFATTAYVNQREVKRCFESGMDDYINKPVLKPKLEAILTKWRKKIH